ncbi:ankyrin repeat-containing protein At5g02620-like [Durio zibethinus]|uniref:Ankyrin repeat-containing protein At5g02620-like n=1 Tax=Durio zibethinus TaxID=66656 RepID=A0A6P5X386_DURZI|nr:ankyrin repeat-containing protein At5g02620-like [Durio zibethinus]
MMQLNPSVSSSIPSEQPMEEKAITYMDLVLFKAAADGDVEAFSDCQVALDCLVDGSQNTVLHIYSRTGGRLVVKNVRAFPCFQKRVFEREFSINFVEQLVNKCPSLLLQRNANWEIPLHIAARHGHSGIVKVLIERANVVLHEDPERGLDATGARQMLRMRDEEENTAFHLAARYGHLDVLRLLVKEDPDFDFSANTSGETPLYLAAEGGYHGMVTEMLDNCKSTVYGGPNGRTALHAAVLAGDEKTVRKLIEAKMQLTKQTDDNGRTPLHYAAHFGKRSIAKVLLEEDASAAYISDKERGMSALHMAAWQGEQGIMEEIISNCPGCCEMVDKRGWNFLHFAVVAVSPKKLKRFLVDNKINDFTNRNLFHEKNVNGYTPLHIYLTGPARQRLGWFSLNSFLLDRELQKHIRQLLNDIGDNAEVEGLRVHPNFRKRVKDEDDVSFIEVVEKTRETHLLVAALVATVTFAAAFTVPGGYKSDEQGDATLSRDPAFKAFIITDTLAFVSSLLAVLLHFRLVFLKWSLVNLRFQVIRLADVLTFSATIAMVIAFSTGSYAVLQSSMGFAIATCSLGLTFVPGLFIAYAIFRFFLGVVLSALVYYLQTWCISNKGPVFAVMFSPLVVDF